MKKVTCFICSMGSGGAEHQMSILATMLVEKGYDVELVTFSGDEYHYPISEQVRRIRIAKTENKILKFLSIFWFFLTHKTNCVISFGQRENLFALVPLVFRPKIKVIAGERNFTIGTISQTERILLNYLYWRADYIVPNSYSQRDHILECKPRFADKVVTITNYTDTSQYTYIPPVNEDVVKIGIFCRYHKQKNYERFAVVVKRLKESGYTQLHIDWFGNLGNGDHPNKDYIIFRRMVEEYNIGDILHLNNHIKNVSLVMPQYDAICVPSLHEGWSNTISEGICCGRPMLVSDVSDNGRMVINGENGFLFNPLEEDEMYKAFVKFLSISFRERELMGKHSREYAYKLFDLDEFITKYVKLIEN